MSHNTVVKAPQSRCFLDYIFFLRPVLHPPVWTIVILGYFASPAHRENTSSLLYLLFFSSAAAGWAYVINQISDIESDKLNNKLYFLPLNLISINAAYIMAAFTAIVTLISYLLLGRVIGSLLLAGLILGYLYSGKPFYWKNHPFFGTLTNSLAHGAMPFIAGYICAGGLSSVAVIHSIPYIFAVIAVYIGTTIPDIDGDKKSGKISPGVALGSRYSAAAMLLSLMAAISSGILLRDLPFLVASNLAIPFYIYAIIRPSSKSAILSVKSSVLFLSLAACIRFWPYAIILFILFICTKFYYKLRFKIDYPSFT